MISQVELTGTKARRLAFNPFFGRKKTAVADSMMAFIRIQRCFGRHGTWIPDFFAVMDIVIFSI